MAEEEEWDTGAEPPGEQDKFNRFEPSLSVGGPPDEEEEEKEIVKATEKPVVKPVDLPTVPLKALSSEEAPKSKPAPSLSVSTSGAESVPAPTLKTPTAGASAPLLSPKKAGSGDGKAFTEKLDAAALKYFNDISEKKFSDQAIAFLNAYWKEVGTQAEFIFTVAFEVIKMADMHAKGVMWVHLYEEGANLDFNIGLYFYEKLCKKVLEDPEGKPWRDNPKFAASMPEMMTAIVRKQEIREKVDVNFDGRISFLEYLLYQYRDFANPADFTQRSMGQAKDSDAILKAKALLEEVNQAIRAYEEEKRRLTEESKQPGVKGLGAKHLLTVLISSPLAEKLSTALIKAEAAVRLAGRQLGAGSVLTTDPKKRDAKPTDGMLWWLSRDLTEKKRRYGREQ